MPSPVLTGRASRTRSTRRQRRKKSHPIEGAQMKIGSLLCLRSLTLLCFLAVSAWAQDSRRDFTLAYFLGGAHTLDTGLEIAQPALGNRLRFDGISFSGRSFEKPLYYGIRAGFFPHRSSHFGVEAEFVHLKVYADAAKPRSEERRVGK